MAEEKNRRRAWLLAAALLALPAVVWTSVTFELYPFDPQSAIPAFVLRTNAALARWLLSHGLSCTGIELIEVVESDDEAIPRCPADGRPVSEKWAGLTLKEQEAVEKILENDPVLRARRYYYRRYILGINDAWTSRPFTKSSPFWGSSGGGGSGGGACGVSRPRLGGS